MKKITPLYFLILLAGAVSCEISPEPIQFGTDSCDFCQMTIVDQQHAAQYVTKKGKQFRFDAIECMLNDLSEKGMENLALLRVADYSRPGEMTDATRATYLISPEIKSPMGANLSSFSRYQDAEEVHGAHSGELYNWKEMLHKYKVAE
jgi:copper chaperone NosL